MIKSLSARNKAFWAKSKPAQRVAIAKDVISQIQLKHLVAEVGNYLEVKSVDDIENPPKKLDEVFKLFRKEDIQCEVCGIGAIFVGLVNLGDKVTTKESFGNCVIGYDELDSPLMRKKLSKVFDEEQLFLIECAFETTIGGWCNWDITPERERAVSFGGRYKSDRNRLIAIMNNIIKNKGTFIP